MWETDETYSVPRTKHVFSISAHRGDLIFMKPGHGDAFENESWHSIKNYGLMEKKICRFVQSQSKKITIHLPKLTPILLIHENRQTSIVLSLPIPFNLLGEEQTYHNLYNYKNVHSEDMIVATTHQRVGDIPFIFNLQSKVSSPFASHVKNMAVNDDGRIIAIEFDEEIWVWNQLPEEIRGDGYWINLTAADSFNHMHFKNDEDVALSPIAFQSLAAFRNPDEGPGICYLSCLLPPCKPFDMLYLFNSVCVFSEQRRYYNYRITIPILEGVERPKYFWSPCCRFLVITVNNSLILLTRDLQIVSTIHLTDVFMGDIPLVSDLAWSCNCEFFVLTSQTGFIGLVTRDGRSLKHLICHIPLFKDDYCMPLYIAGDTSDPYLYTIYSDKYMRFLRLDKEAIEPTLSNLLALPFPIKNAEPFIKDALLAIDGINPNNPYALVKLLYLTELYGIFKYMSPLRYPIFTKLNAGLKCLLASGQYLFTFFLLRCVFYVTGLEPDVYKTVRTRLGYSTNKRDKILLKLLDSEINKEDWGYRYSELNSTIKMYGEENKGSLVNGRTRPDPNRDVDVLVVLKAVREILYDPDFYNTDEIPIDLTLLFDTLVDLGRFDRAALLIGHESLSQNPMDLFLKIVSKHACDPISIFKAMEVCINSQPIDEPEFRAVAVMALNNILKQMISDSAPTSENPKPQFISNLCIIEDAIDIPVPENIEQCKDFAVLLGIALCAADYVNIHNFCNGKSKHIAEHLLGPLRELIQLIWFVKWRYLAMKEACIQKMPGDATLRLLNYNEFIDTAFIRQNILKIGKNHFDKEVYKLYIEDCGEFESDPEFVDFMCEMDIRVTPRILSRIQIAISSFALELEKLSESQILTATICSHVIPWLRCGIPRKMIDFTEVREVVPNEMVEFEEFTLLESPSQLQVEKPPPIEVSPVTELIEEVKEEESLPEMKKVEEKPPEMPDSIPTPDYDGERMLSEGEEAPKPKKEHHKKPPIKHKPKKEEKPQKKKPMLKLIEVNKPPKYAPVQIQAPPPQQSEFVPGYPFNPLSYCGPPIAIFQATHAPFPAQTYGPIWDLDPSLYERPYPKPPPNIPLTNEPDIPTRQNVEAQCEPRLKVPRPKVILTSAVAHDLSSVSASTETDASLSSDHDKTPAIDPFPLDDELRKRVDNLLNNPLNIKTPSLPEKPRYISKIVRTEHIIEHEMKESK